tara:strand:- start:865 stop:1062 length:198 start_codon:yes stop_codon:yes gene_type:complete
MLQIVLGLMLILGSRIKEVAINLAFWNDCLKPGSGQEPQNLDKSPVIILTNGELSIHPLRKRDND